MLATKKNASLKKEKKKPPYPRITLWRKKEIKYLTLPLPSP
jgi:hypothetical protein